VNNMPPLNSHNRFACLEVDNPIEPLICITDSTEVMHTTSHPPIPNWRSQLPAWERWLPIIYVVAASPGPMSLVVDMEIESMDTVVKQCTQAHIDCSATGCFIEIEWVKHHKWHWCNHRHSPLHPMLWETLRAYSTGHHMSWEAEPNLGGYNWLQNRNPEINW
jgi:hypothetical protein